MNDFNKSKKIDSEHYYNYLRILNLIYIILFSLLYLLYLLTILIVCIKEKLENLVASPKLPPISKITEKVTEPSENEVYKQNKTTNNKDELSSNDINIKNTQ